MCSSFSFSLKFNWFQYKFPLLSKQKPEQKQNKISIFHSRGCNLWMLGWMRVLFWPAVSPQKHIFHCNNKFHTLMQI